MVGKWRPFWYDYFLAKQQMLRLSENVMVVRLRVSKDVACCRLSFVSYLQQQAGTLDPLVACEHFITPKNKQVQTKITKLQIEGGTGSIGGDSNAVMQRNIYITASHLTRNS